jgi:hypothetical protein
MPSSEGTGASRYVGATYEGNTLADEVGVYWGREENCERKDVEFEYVNGGEKGPNKTVVASRLDTIDIGSGPEQHCVASLAWTVGSEPGLQTLRARPARVAPPPNTKSETQTNRLRPVEFQAVVHKNLGFVFGAGRVASTPDSADFNDGVGPGPRGELNDQYQPIIGIDFSLATRNSRLQRYLLDALRFSVVTSAEQIGDDLYVGVQLLPVLRHYTRWSDVGAGPRAAKFPLQFTAAWRTGFKFEHDEWAILLHYSTGSLLSTITGAFKGSS